MSSDTTKSFFKDYKINNQDFAKIINCVEAHNGTIKFECIEAEICANADCYRFIHPKGVLSYLSTLARRSEYFQNNLNQLEKKLDEKYNIISLDLVKKELEPYYISFKQMIIESKK